MILMLVPNGFWVSFPCLFACLEGAGVNRAIATMTKAHDCYTKNGGIKHMERRL